MGGHEETSNCSGGVYPMTVKVLKKDYEKHEMLCFSVFIGESMSSICHQRREGGKKQKF